VGYLCLAWRDEQTQKCDAADERPRIWYTDVDEENNASEIEFLRKAIHQKDVGLRVQAVSAFNRFSAVILCSMPGIDAYVAGLGT
jgi:hypothetical protein